MEDPALKALTDPWAGAEQANGTLPTPSTINYGQTHAPAVPVLIAASSLVFTVILLLKNMSAK